MFNNNMGETSFKNAEIVRKYQSRQRHSSPFRAKAVIWLSVACTLLFFLVLVLGIKLGMYAKENEDLTIIDNKQTRELESLRPDIKRLRSEIKQLVRGRIPYLKELKFDVVIKIEYEYVRNIVFTLASNKDMKQYEYKMVMDNRTLNAVHPHVKLLFFNDIGIEVGSSVIGVDDDGVANENVLERGEIRTHSAAVELSDDLDPTYFMMRVIEPSYAAK